MSLHRRAMLALMGGIGIGVFAGYNLGRKSLGLQGIGGKAAKPRYKLYTMGRQANRHPAFHGYTDPEASVLTEWDIQSDRLRQVLVPVHDGHQVLPLPDVGKLYCCAQYGQKSVIVDLETLKVEKTLERPDMSYVPSGHGVYFPERKVVIESFYRSGGYKATGNEENKTSTHGALGIYSTDDFRLLEWKTSGGYNPHELRILPGGKEIVIAHQGGGESFKSGPVLSGLDFEITRPEITIVDAQTLEVKRSYPQGKNAGLPHMALDNKGNVFAVWQQYVMRDNPAAIQRELGRISFPLDADEHHKIAIPYPLLKVNPYTGERTEFFTAPLTQRRSQSVTCHTQSGTVIANYLFTNTLVIVRPDAKKPDVIDGRDLGLTGVMGVCDLPGTPYFGVCDLQEGMALVEARTLKPALHRKVSVYRTSHLYEMPT